MFLENSSNCVGGDWVGDNGMNVVGGLNSIGSLAGSDLCNDGVCGSGRKL